MKKALQEQARLLGDMTFTAYCKTCQALKPHYVSSCDCVDCRRRRHPPKGRKVRTMTQKEYNKAYYWKNKEALNQKKRDDYWSDVELSRLENRTRWQERQKRIREANKLPPLQICVKPQNNPCVCA